MPACAGGEGVQRPRFGPCLTGPPDEASTSANSAMSLEDSGPAMSSFAAARRASTS